MFLKRVARDSILFSLANFGTRILGMLLVPLYVRYIIPEEYGQLDVLQTITSILSMLLVFGLPSALTRYFYSVDEAERPRLASTGFFTILMFALPATALLLLFSRELAELFFPFDNSVTFIRLLCVTLLLNLLNRYLTTLMVIKGNTHTFVFVNLSHTLLALGLNVLFVAGFRLAIVGLLLASALALVPKLIAQVWILRHQLRLEFDRALYRKMLRFGLPMIVANISGWILSSSDRFFLVHYSSYEQVGLYSIAYKFAGGISFMLFTPFTQAWTRSAFQDQSSSNLPALINQSARLFIAAGLFVTVASSMLIPEVLVILTTPSYYGAYVAYPFIVASLFAFSLNRLLEVPLHLKDRSGISSTLGLVAMCVNLALNFLLIPRWGILGASIATWAAYTVNNVAFYILVRRINPMPYPVLAALAYMLCGFAMIALALFVMQDMHWLLKLLMLLPYGAALAWWNRQELGQLLRKLQRRFGRVPA